MLARQLELNCWSTFMRTISFLSGDPGDPGAPGDDGDKGGAGDPGAPGEGGDKGGAGDKGCVWTRVCKYCCSSASNAKIFSA